MRVFKKLLYLFILKELNHLKLIIILLFILALLDMIGIVFILPFMSVSMNPNIIESNIF